jgi:chaperonin GroES
MAEENKLEQGVKRLSSYFQQIQGATGEPVFIAFENIAEDLDDDLLLKIGRCAVEGYTSDKDSMQEWVDGVELGLDLVKQEKESRSEPWAGAANFKSPTLMSAALKFSDRASTELLRGRDIAKTAVIGKDDDNQKADRAERVSEFTNYQLNVQMPEWREEHDKLLYDLPYIGVAFKKTFFDPRLGRNVSNLISYPGFVVSNTADSITRLRRFSEVFELSKNEVLERQNQGLWLDVSVEGTTTDSDEGDEAESDKFQEFIEQQGYYDIDGDGYEEPYVFTVHLSTSKVMRIVPRFGPENVIVKKVNRAVTLDTMMDKDVDVIRIEPENNITKYGFLRDPQGGFLDVGYGHLLGALTAGINATTNQLIDSGTLANVQGGWLAKGFRKRMGDTRIKPGIWNQTGLTAQDMQNGIMPHQFKEPSATLFALMEMMVGSSQELSASADLTQALGANAPATTTLALIQEQQLSSGAVILRIYRSMTQEFKKLYVLNSKFTDPEEYKNILDDEKADFAKDFNLKGVDVVPVANPEVSSKIQRIQLAQAELTNLEAVMAAGGNIRPIVEGFYEAIGSSNVAEIFPEETPEEQLQRLLQDPALMELVTQEQQRITEIADAQQAAIAREEDRKDLELADKLESNDKTREKTESETLLNLEKAETEESKNLRDDYTAIAQVKQQQDAAVEAAQPQPATEVAQQ